MQINHHWYTPCILYRFSSMSCGFAETNLATPHCVAIDLFTLPSDGWVRGDYSKWLPSVINYTIHDTDNIVYILNTFIYIYKQQKILNCYSPPFELSCFSSDHVTRKFLIYKTHSVFLEAIASASC